jgi:hypothetical protein
VSEVIWFSAPLPPVGLRRNSQTPKHGYRAALVREYQEQVYCEGANASLDFANAFPDKPWEKAHMRLVWRHAGVGPDHDNALRWLDPLIRVCTTGGERSLGIVVSDVPECLTVQLETEKVRSRNQEGVIVEIVRAS